MCVPGLAGFSWAWLAVTAYAQCTSMLCNSNLDHKDRSLEEKNLEWIQERIVGSMTWHQYLLHNMAVQQQEALQALQAVIQTGPRHFYSSCWQLKKAGYLDSGLYDIHVGPHIHRVYCDMDVLKGGWIVFQRRFNGSVDFNQTWSNYSNGFGDLSGEFWLGNNIIYQITNMESQSLRIELGFYDGDEVAVTFPSFSIGPESQNYKLELWVFDGDRIGYSLAMHRGSFFSTPDRDNDRNPDGNCAEQHSGGWWYDDCVFSDLNAPWSRQKRLGIIWGHFRDINSTRMMIRPNTRT